LLHYRAAAYYDFFLPQCGKPLSMRAEMTNELIAPEKSEFRDGKHIRHLWLCPKCTTCFESLESVPVEAMTADDVALSG
jgi:hypothetical protein